MFRPVLPGKCGMRCYMFRPVLPGKYGMRCYMFRPVLPGKCGMRCYMFRPVLPGKCWNTASTLVTPASFQTVSNLLFTNNHINPLKPELNPICYLLALLGVHHFLYVSRIRVKLLTFRLLMSYIYGAPILDVSRSHTTTQHSR